MKFAPARAGPARVLGLPDKGHLGVGADADIAIYSPDSDWQRTFELPYLVVHGGTIVVDQGEPRPARNGALLSVRAQSDPSLDLEMKNLLARR